MKNMWLILLLSCLLSPCWGQSDSLFRRGFDNTYLYQRYVQRPDLTVARLIHFPIDSSSFLNGLMIRADSDASWEALLAEHSLPVRDSLGAGFPPRAVGLVARDRFEPTLEPAVVGDKIDFMSCCLLIFSYDDHILWLLHYSTAEDATKLIKTFYLKQIKHER